jgi:molecular chaperone IbpA
MTPFFTLDQPKRENFPPYNIVKLDDTTSVIEIALAGFSRDEISITLKEQHLQIEGTQSRSDDGVRFYLHRGIGTRRFKQTYKLMPFTEVVEADYQDGVLSILLKTFVPEEMKPRTIPIGKPKDEPQLLNEVVAE